MDLTFKYCFHPFPLKTHRPHSFFPPKPITAVTTTAVPATSRDPTSASDSLHAQTLKTLEWPSLCSLLSPFTSTPMGLHASLNSLVPIGNSLPQSRRLLSQTSDALRFLSEKSGPPSGLSAVEDVREVLEDAAASVVLKIADICSVRRALAAVRKVAEELTHEDGVAGTECVRYSSLVEILSDCDFRTDLEQKIGFCLDCNLSVILDEASEDLEIIRSERRKNAEKLDSLLKRVSAEVFRAGGIDRPLITERRSRMCVGVRATHKHLLPDGIVLDSSSSGATYFMEPSEAVELNNMEVRLSDAEKAEESAILSLLTFEIGQSEAKIKHMLDRVQELDIAFAKASYAQSVNGVPPELSSPASRDLPNEKSNNGLMLHIEGIQHPLLLESSRKSSTQISVHPGNSENSALRDGSSHDSDHRDFPVPIDINIGHGTRVVIISGPNTGGKTASMKTLGLASLMSKAGMYLPAKNSPQLPWFDHVLVDIGDHQSLEQNLSTFSGHVARLSEILERTTEESLVLIDEIGSGTDPAEGVALSSSILHYLKGRVCLAVVTTHYADLTLLKERDSRFENAAMEFSLETLQPTYRITWGNSGSSNALQIALSIGFDENIIQRARHWVERLRPERQREQKGLLYQSLLEERNRLETEAKEAASVHAEVMNRYKEIKNETERLENQKKAIMVKETELAQYEFKNAESQIRKTVDEFEELLINAEPDQINAFLRKFESAIGSIIEAYQPSELDMADRSEDAHDLNLGEQVRVKGLGNKLATVVEAPGDDDTILVQFGKVRVRINKGDATAITRSSGISNSGPSSSTRKDLRSKELPDLAEVERSNLNPSGLVFQTSRNTVDLRGRRVEEAAIELNLAIASAGGGSVLFVIHGMGTGAVKERVLAILRDHPRVLKHEQESPTNYGCTIAFIK
ncbi:hypothetical protein MLD38_016754 [Melastoma candidum]|uniref:Uncharacterized protein n=1 Tax=Melastoma candidum TaxID=119954 RepID=A0ACB9QWN3_9MYRT|nr:hypothetical protein MLD38_016754 [Melastoma candidum]